MSETIKFFICLSVTILAGFGFGPLLKKVKDRIELVPPRDDLSEKWKAITSQEEKDVSGKVLGCLEQLLFFISIWINSHAIIAGWLTFKVGSKWQVWSNVIAVPKSIEGVDELDYLFARRRWGSQRLMTFLIGTLSNVLAAFVGVYFGKHGCEAIRWLVY